MLEEEVLFRTRANEAFGRGSHVPGGVVNSLGSWHEPLVEPTAIAQAQWCAGLPRLQVRVVAVHATPSTALHEHHRRSCRTDGCRRCSVPPQSPSWTRCQPEAPRILVATGKLVGERFDHPPLHTLVLAMPVSWKGTLQQYAGRLHREHASKADVRIIDFVDTGHPAPLRVWEKRQRGYCAMGYRVGLDASSGHASMEDAEVAGFVPSE